MIDTIWLTMPSYKLNELSLSSESIGREKESAKILDRERGCLFMYKRQMLNLKENGIRQLQLNEQKGGYMFNKLVNL